MRVVEVRNVHEAWARLPGVLSDAEAQVSRAGHVLVCPEPVTTVYLRPTERVLLDERRDANPFFHLVEALWMLAGRDDAATLNHYVRDFGRRFAEDNGSVHGAYGYRWRHALGFDQLDAVVQKLRNNPSDRQAVIQMWDGRDDQHGCDDLCGEHRDRPCNTHVYLRVRRQHTIRGGEQTYDDALDITVCCRSNDMVFGGYGANAVHFSVLQEYLAARIGVDVGTYTQISNNFHVYQDVWLARRPEGDDVYEHPEWGPSTLGCAPMVSDPERFDQELGSWFSWHEELWEGLEEHGSVASNVWLSTVAGRMVKAYWLYRQKQLPAAASMARAIECPSWRVACLRWLARRGAT